MQRNGISFKGQNIFIGIDVHLKTWAVAIMTESGTFAVFPTKGNLPRSSVVKCSLKFGLQHRS
jgi:hypothetical protein